jgi:hypothetical protein
MGIPAMSISSTPLRRHLDKGQIQIWSWANIKRGDELGHLSPGSDSFCVQVMGIFGGASVVLEGSLDESSFGSLPQNLGDTSVIKNSNIIGFSSPVPWIRPRLIGGDDTTNLTIMLAAVLK